MAGQFLDLTLFERDNQDSIIDAVVIFPVVVLLIIFVIYFYLFLLCFLSRKLPLLCSFEIAGPCKSVLPAAAIMVAGFLTTKKSIRSRDLIESGSRHIIMIVSALHSTTTREFIALCVHSNVTIHPKRDDLLRTTHLE